MGIVIGLLILSVQKLMVSIKYHTIEFNLNMEAKNMKNLTTMLAIVGTVLCGTRASTE
jgi:hypothetical protein